MSSAPETVPVDDRGLLLADGLFETVLWAKGRLDRFDRHVTRMIRGCDALGLPPPDEAGLAEAALGAVERAGLTGARAAVRLTWTAGSGGRGLDRPAAPAPRLFASAAVVPETYPPAELVRVPVRRNEGSPASRHKTLAYLDNVLARRAAGGAEALMLNNAGKVACAAAANLFWFEDGRLCTPAPDCGALEGIMRAAVIEAAAGQGIRTWEVTSGFDALRRAEGLFLTNSLIGVRPVATCEGLPVPPRPEVAALAAAVLP
jgi:branched-chain amino acid aminotransferase/4-amino-4-deoxychorismate lyase